MPRIRVSGPAGSAVKLTPAEIVNRDGSIQRVTMGSADRGSSWWKYTKSTDGEETWFPRFYYLGSRYVQADCQPAAEGSAPAKIESIEMVVVHSAAAPAGEFETSDPLINQIRDMVRWAQRSNMVSIFTDCPHREKLGWLEQTHLNGPSLRYEWDVSRLVGKTVRDISEARTAEGLVPNIAPEYVKFRGQFRTAAEWGAAFIALPWQQYQFVGDRRLLVMHYDGMRRYFAFLQSRANDDIISGDDDALGDWYDYGPQAVKEPELTPPANTATAMFFQNAVILARAAEVLGRPDDAATYARHAERIRHAYNTRFFDVEAGAYKPSSQTSNAMPLVIGIVPPDQRHRVQAALVREIEKAGYALNSGGIGTRYVIQALTQAGRSDLIFRILHNADKPGYAFLVKRGETTLTEAWDGRRNASHNHFMLGQITEWFYKDLAGIDSDPAEPGFKKIIIRPNPVGDIAWVRASYESIHGKIAVRWERRGERFILDATIPPNTTATIHLPAREGAEVLEGGVPAAQAAGVQLVEHADSRAVLAVQSGSYHFEAR